MLTDGEVFPITDNGFTETFMMSYGPTEDVLIAIPEPQAWGLMVGGLGILGAGARFRRRKQGV